MTLKKAREKFFDGHAFIYNQNCFTQNTVAEVEFLLEALELRPGARVLDVGCGTGRHAIELARRGYAVTGLDLSAGMLEQARQGAEAAGVKVRWRQGDDAIGQPLAILRCVAKALKRSAKCLLTVLNGLAMARRHTPSEVEQGIFDALTLTERSDCAPAPGAAVCSLRERGFVRTELGLLFQMAGFEVLGLWGGTAGNWARRRVELDEMEIMILARSVS